MILQELMNSVIPYTWTRGPSSYLLRGVATFTVEDVEYVVSFGPTSGVLDTVEVEFTVDTRDEISTYHTTNVTGTGNAFVVFSTVQKIIKDFISQANPHHIVFHAAERSRIKLYDRLVKTVRWPVERITLSGGGIHYTLTNPDWKPST